MENTLVQISPNKTFGWAEAWNNGSYKIKLFAGIVIFALFPWKVSSYFAYIQTREGAVLSDFVLDNLPAADVSTWIFGIMYLAVIYMLIRLVPNPTQILIFVITYNLETIFRMVTIYLFPLNPPEGLVVLKDPLAEIFIYGKSEPVTKDLFFSGHTATMLLVCLFLPGKWEKRIASLLCGGLVCLLLVQHIHYTIDIIGAFFFTFLAYFLGKKIALPL